MIAKDDGYIRLDLSSDQTERFRLHRRVPDKKGKSSSDLADIVLYNGFKMEQKMRESRIRKL